MLWLHTGAGKALGQLWISAGCPGLLPGGAGSSSFRSRALGRREHPCGARPRFKGDECAEAKLCQQQRSTCTIQPAPAENHSLHTAPSGGVTPWSLSLRHLPASPKYLSQTSLEGERVEGVCSLPKTTMKSSLLKWLLLPRHPSHKQGTRRG